MFLLDARNESENQEMSRKIGSVNWNRLGSANWNRLGYTKLTHFKSSPVLYQNGTYTSSRRNQSAHVGDLQRL
jgi:hypothetical protein